MNNKEKLKIILKEKDSKNFLKNVAQKLKEYEQNQKAKKEVKDEKEKDKVSPTESISAEKTTSNPASEIFNKIDPTKQKEASVHFEDGLEKVAYATGIDSDYIKDIIKEAADFSDLVSLKNEGKISKKQLNKAKNMPKDKLDDFIKKVQKNNAIDASTNESFKKKMKNKIKDKKRDFSLSDKKKKNLKAEFKDNLGGLAGHSLLGAAAGGLAGSAYDKSKDEKSNKGKMIGGLAGAGIGGGYAAKRLLKNAAVRGMAEHYNDNERLYKNVDHRYGEETKDMTPPQLRRDMRQHESGSNKSQKGEKTNKEKIKKILKEKPTGTGAGTGALLGGLAGAAKGKMNNKSIAKSVGKGTAAGGGFGVGVGFANKLINS